MKLEVGCGNKKRNGYLGMDLINLEGVDVVHNMNNVPWPFHENQFDEIVFDDVLEHSHDILSIISEVYRIASNNCIVKISVPHFSSDNMYTDPTHKVFFSSRSFNYFDKQMNHKHSFYLSGVNLKVNRAEIHFREYFLHENEKQKFNPSKYMGIEFLANKFNRVYERFFAWIFPASELYFELEVLKEN